MTIFENVTHFSKEYQICVLLQLWTSGKIKKIR